MRITELRVQGLRTLANIRLPLDGLTVLIGENGSGKSSILEACEILRRVPSDSFLHDLHAIHGGMAALLRNGAQRIKLGVNVQGGNGSQYAYDLTLGMQGGFGVLEEEDLHALRDDDPTRISRQ